MKDGLILDGSKIGFCVEHSGDILYLDPCHGMSTESIHSDPLWYEKPVQYLQYKKIWNESHALYGWKLKK